MGQSFAYLHTIECQHYFEIAELSLLYQLFPTHNTKKASTNMRIHLSKFCKVILNSTFSHLQRFFFKSDHFLLAGPGCSQIYCIILRNTDQT